MAVLNQEQKALLSENDIDKISFKSGNATYEYSIKNMYADKIREMLR